MFYIQILPSKTLPVYASILEKLINTNMCLILLKHGGMFAAHQVAHIAEHTALLTLACLHCVECNDSTVTSAGTWSSAVQTQSHCSFMLEQHKLQPGSARLRPSPSPWDKKRTAAAQMRREGLRLKLPSALLTCWTTAEGFQHQSQLCRG